MEQRLPVVPGRGAATDPPNRFERLHVEMDPPAGPEGEGPGPVTEFLLDRPRRIVARNESPDVGFERSVNPYRGCEHGCIYCYARPTHEYLGLSSGLDFERRIFARPDAPILLRRELADPSWTPETVVLSGVTDPYQPGEARLRITRGCLEVLAEARNPVAVVTKNHLVTRDTDLLLELAGHGAAAVTLSITSLRRDLQKTLEPRTASPKARLKAVETLAEAGIPVGVNVAPVIPGLTDEELPAILAAAASAGATAAGYILLRLPHAVAPLFSRWLSDHVPDRAEKVMNRIRACRSGRLNDPRFGSRMKGQGIFAEQVEALFRVESRRLGLEGARRPLSTQAFRRPTPPPSDPDRNAPQLDLFSSNGRE